MRIGPKRRPPARRRPGSIRGGKPSSPLSLFAALCLLATPAAAAGFDALKGHGGPIMGLAVAPDGRVASASFDNAVGLWTDGAPRWLDGHEAAVTAVAFDADGRPVSGADDFTVRSWPDGRILWRHEGKVTSVAVAPDGAVASGSWDGTVRIGSGDGPPLVLSAGSGVNDVAFSSDGTALFAATMAGEVQRHDRTAGGARVLLRHGFGVNALAAAEGWLAYGAVDGVTRVIDPATGDALADYTLDRRPILSMAHHAGTDRLAVGDGDGFIMVLDTADWSLAADMRATRQGPVWALAWSPDGGTLYAGGLDDAVYAWPAGTLDAAAPAIDGTRDFLRDPATMPNGERQFMRKCSVCHDLTAGPSRRAGPTLAGLFGRVAGTVEGYAYSDRLARGDITWGGDTIDALFDHGPDRYVPGSKMPMQVIAAPGDRADLIAFLKTATEMGR